jgi:hypothetical protein
VARCLAAPAPLLSRLAQPRSAESQLMWPPTLPPAAAAPAAAAVVNLDSLQ